MKLKLLVTILLLSTIGYSQESYNLEEVKKIKYEHFNSKNLPSETKLVTENGYYFLETSYKKKDKEYVLYYYNKDLELVNSKKLNIPVSYKYNRIRHLSFAKNKILIFVSVIDRKKNVRSIKMFSYDFASLDEIEEPKIIHQSKYKYYSTYSELNRYCFSQSPNSKYLLLCESIYTTRKKTEIGFVILNKENGNIQTGNIQTGFNGKFLKIQNIKITNSREVFILSKLHLKYDLKIEYSLHKITKQDKASFKLELNKNIRDISMNLDSNQIPFFMGFDLKKKYRGIVLIRIEESSFRNNDFKFIYTYADCTDNETYALYKKKHKPSINHLRTIIIRSVFHKANGNFIIIGEESYRTASGSSDNPIYYYFHNNVIISEHNEKGEIVWNHIVKKHGSSRSNIPKEYFLLKNKDAFYLVYNSSRKKKKGIKLTHINNEGEIESNYLGEYNSSTIQTRNINISDKGFLLFIKSKTNGVEIAKYMLSN